MFYRIKAETDFLTANPLGLLNCYCLTGLYENGFSVTNTVFPITQKELCQDWFEKYAISNLLIYAIVAAIVIVNIMIKTILRCKESPLL